jgi:DNA/RNA-binding domain of Phe-tRNA-synthetase-like protein
MIDISIYEELKKVCPKITLGCIEASVTVENSSDGLLKDIDDYCNVLNEEINIENLSELPQIKDGRDVYKKLGKAPSKYRLSSEALIRRVLQGKGLYRINNIVDINNLISLKSKFPVGSYNIDHLHSPISLMIGKEGEQYKGIGKDLLNISNLPILTDSIGSFGSPTSDSERAMITSDVNKILICIYSFSGKADVEIQLKYGSKLIERYANGKDIETQIIF